MRTSTLAEAAPVMVLAMVLVMTMAMPPQAAAEQATATVTGRALDLMLESPVVSAEVFLINESERRAESTRTDAEGRFRFERVPTGMYRLRADTQGYMEVITPLLEVEEADSTFVVEIIVWMSPDVVPLAPLEVVATSRPPIIRRGLAEFRERAERRRSGRFIMGEDIGPSTRRITDVLVGSGVEVINGRGVVVTRNSCVPAVWIDGVRVVREEGAIPSDVYEAINVLDPTEVEGIEIYSSPLQLPAMFAGMNASCGVISMWSRL